MAEETKKITKSMLIIKSDANSLRGVEQFLKNREWHLGSTHQMKDAILYLVQNKPSFVLVTVDHPNSKMRKLPKVISSAFPCCVMVYAEKATTASFKLLMDSGMEYKINPPVTGPAIERAVNKFIRDQEQAARQQAEGVASGEKEKNNFEFQVEIKSGGEKESSLVSIKGGEAGALDGEGATAAAAQNSLAQKLLAQLGDESDSSSGPAGFLGGPGSKNESGKNPAGELINIQKDNADAGEAGYFPTDSEIALEGGAKKNRAASPGELNVDPRTLTAAQIAAYQGKKKNLNLAQIASLEAQISKMNPADFADLQNRTAQEMMGGRKPATLATAEGASSSQGAPGSLDAASLARKKALGQNDENSAGAKSKAAPGELAAIAKRKLREDLVLTPEEMEQLSPEDLATYKKRRQASELAAKNGNKAADDVLIGDPQIRKNKPTPKSEDDDEASKDLYVPAREEKKGTGLSGPENDPKSSRPAPIIGSEVEGDSKNLTSADSLKVRNGGYFDEESMLVKGVNRALDDTVVKNGGQVDAQLEDNSHLACIIVESTRFSGYLVAALGKDKRLDAQFVELVRIKLVKFLKDNGEPIDNEANLQLKVKRVDFEGWALEYAQFLRKSVHKGDEVAMAFFPFADAQTKVGESATANMVTVKTEDIQTEVPLEFNMYIYLPTNKKYILYTPQGGVFLSEQKTRLTRQGVTKMHIQKEDVQNLSKFKAQNHLNSLIKDYESKEASKPASSKKKKAA